MKKSFIFTAVCAAAALSAADNGLIRNKLVAGETEEFRLVANKPELFNRRPLDGSKVKMDCDKNNLYLKLEMVDGDIISEAKENQSPLNRLGDAVRVFLKPADKTDMWEIVFAPNNLKSCFYHLGPGAMFYPEPGSAFPEFTVKNSIKNGVWSADVTIPLSIFRAKGFKFDKSEKWHIMIVRRNFSRLHSLPEESSYPQAIGNVAFPDYFAELITK
ncbi:MAG: hypothetical protein E7058_05015 [Lentisphaerae bacterium]|nr:hypothetical protein [Lentisphaerota bacterium]